jgi:ABC-2 type transport system permease protein
VTSEPAREGDAPTAPPPDPTPAPDPAPAPAETAPVDPAPADPAPVDPATQAATDTEAPRAAPIEAGSTPPAALEPRGLTPPATPAPEAPLLPRPDAPPGSVGTRIVAVGWLALSALLVWFFAGHAFASDLGTENARLRLVVRLLSVAVPAYPGLLALQALATGRRPDPRFNVLSLPFEGWWLATLATLWWREVKGFFFRPGIASIVLFVWLIVNGYFFVRLIDYYGGPEAWGKDFQAPPSTFITGNYIVFLALVFITPALTMRLLAEEASTGSLEMLLTSPVTHAQVVLSKFLGALTFYAGMLASMAIFLVVLRTYATEWDWGPVLGGYLGLFLLGAFFISIGLFTSSITDNQIVAFILGALPNFLLFFLFFAQGAVSSDWLRAVIEHINVWELHQEFVKGVVHWRALAFYLSSTAFFLFLAVRGVESHTWR